MRLAKVMLVLAAAAAAVGAAALLAREAPTPSVIAPTPSFSLEGTVIRVADGDTLIARVGRTNERVRLVGINSPELGTCYGAQATAQARKLALNRPVRLIGDSTQARRDRFGRLLAYVQLPGARDLGRELISEGFARVYVFNRPFARLSTYRSSEAAARERSAGLWSACSTGSP